MGAAARIGCAADDRMRGVLAVVCRGVRAVRVRCIDVESTGLLATDKLVEIASVDLVDGVVSGVASRLCNPGIPIPPEISAIHHIIDEDVADCPPWNEVLPLFVDDSVDAYCAHQSKFERQWLTDEITHGKPWICTLRCAYRIWPDAPGHNVGALRYWLKPEGLDRSIASLAHRAGPDAYVTAHLLNAMFKHPKVDLAGLILCSSRPALLPKVQFGKHFGKKWCEVEQSYLDWVCKQPDMDEDVRYTAAHWLKVAA